MKSTIVLMIAASLALTACDGDKKTTNAAPAVVKKYSKATTLTGTISNNKGVIKSGVVEASDESGRHIAQTAVQNGRYSVEIPAETALPILLTFTPENSSEKLVAAVIHPSQTNYAISPLTTAIAKAAKAMGGYTHAHMVAAAEQSVHVPDENKTSSGWRGDPTTQYGGWH